MTAPSGRPATTEDLITYYGERPKRSVRAFVFEHEGKILGVGGVMCRGPGCPAFLFSDIKPEAMNWPKSMVKVAKQALAALGSAPILAIADPNRKNSTRLLTYLGFKHFATGPTGEIFQWRAP